MNNHFNMFKRTELLEAINLSSFNTEYIEDISYMFTEIFKILIIILFHHFHFLLDLTYFHFYLFYLIGL